MADKIKIKKFDMNQLKKDAIIVLLGKRRTGKSFMVKDILYHKRKDLPMGTVISRTDKLSHFYDEFIPKLCIHERYSADILDKVIQRQAKANKENWKQKGAFLLMDDCLADAANWIRDETIKEIFYNGRWYKLLFILTMQAPMAIPPALRTNIDYTIILKNNNNSDREKIYKHYAGVFPTREMFEKVLDACTEDYTGLIIDNTTHSNKLEDQIYYYKASSHDDFKMFPDIIWERSNQLYKKYTDDNLKTGSKYKYI
jgi:hypothetical protein